MKNIDSNWFHCQWVLRLLLIADHTFTAVNQVGHETLWAIIRTRASHDLKWNINFFSYANSLIDLAYREQKGLGEICRYTMRRIMQCHIVCQSRETRTDPKTFFRITHVNPLKVQCLNFQQFLVFGIKTFECRSWNYIKENIFMWLARVHLYWHIHW